jgi:NAD(P)H-hydrate epimerase
MTEQIFFTIEGKPIPHVNEAQMREVDRIAVEDFRLGILQMMENAGGNLAQHAMEMLDNQPGKIITIAAGSGGNGGGGMCAARHLHNRGYRINLLLTRSFEELQGAAKTQLDILLNSGLTPIDITNTGQAIAEADLVIDALIGYSLKGAPRGVSKEIIELINQSGKRVLSLDIPSGIDATSGIAPGVFIAAHRTLTLALPKPGLTNPVSGLLFLADIGIPPAVYRPLGIEFVPFFGENSWVALKTWL